MSVSREFQLVLWGLVACCAAFSGCVVEVNRPAVRDGSAVDTTTACSRACLHVSQCPGASPCTLSAACTPLEACQANCVLAASCDAITGKDSAAHAALTTCLAPCAGVLPPDGSPMDTKPSVDTKPPVDTSPPVDAGVDKGVDVGPSQYSVLVGLVESIGKETATGPALRLGGNLAFVSRVSPPDPLDAPDFVDSPSPPQCYAHKWTATQPKKGNAWDAGKLTIKGHKTGADVVYIDGDDIGTSCTPACSPPQYCKKNGTCGVPSAVPATIDFTRQQVTGTNQHGYFWNLPKRPVLPNASWFDGATTLTIGAAGGADVPAFSKTGVVVASAPSLTTDLTALDPAGININWNTVSGATLVVISIQSYLADKSEGVDITCLTLAILGSKNIPAGALALIPSAGTTPDKALVIRTVVLGMSGTDSKETWGTWLVGAGEGFFGVTCRMASGVVPCL